MERYEWAQASEIQAGDYLHCALRVVSNIVDRGWILKFEFEDGMTLAFRPDSQVLRRLTPTPDPA